MRCAAALVLFAALLLAAFTGDAIGAQQAAPPGAVGRIDGGDITLENGASVNAAAAGSFVIAGSVVTVHSGAARLTLLTGGVVEICGPAKFTVLESGGAITLALNFGRVRAELPAAVQLRIFTPTIVATPLDIGGAARDITVGLDLRDSLCVRASGGALQLESQFSDEKLVVPENAEFFLANGKLAPVPGTSGSCQCDAAQQLAGAQAQPPAPAVGRPAADGATKVVILPETPPSQPPSALTPAPARVTSAPVEPPLVSPNLAAPAVSSAAPPVAAEPDRAVPEINVLANGNASRPLAPAPRNAVPAAPNLNSAPQSVVAPGLAFTTSIAAPPTRPSVNVILMAREAQVDPDWEFKGRVEPPEFASAMQRALGEKPVAAQSSTTSTPPSTANTIAPALPARKKGGFWSSLKRVFVGNSPSN
ncbi:MAG: hypothetical protein WBZ32_10615 [Candidatus Acidiferrales bacterium]